MIGKYHMIALAAAAFLAAHVSVASEPGTWLFARSLCADPKAMNIGDLITVLIEEETSVSMDAKNSSKNASAASGSLSFGHPKVDDQPTAWTNISLPAWSLETERTFEGDGSRESSDKFTSRITAHVIDVMPNGNLLIEGSRSVKIHEELAKVILTGTVRPSDISRDNVVKSSCIADTTIRYESQGPLVKNVKRGVLSSVLNWLNPF
jgi:flagellar L-ring protein FlgH